MKQAQRQQLKDFFEKELAQGKQELLQLTSNGPIKLDSNYGDMVDRFQIDRERELQLKLQRRKFLYLQNIKHALVKMETGEFGVCHECDGEITFARLKARPMAKCCITCKEEKELIEGQTAYDKRSKSGARAPSTVVHVAFDEQNAKSRDLKDYISAIDQNQKLA